MIAWRASPTRELADRLAAGGPDQVRDVWHALTAELHHATRADLCSRHAAMAPVLQSVAGPYALGDLAWSLIACQRWWP